MENAFSGVYACVCVCTSVCICVFRCCVVECMWPQSHLSTQRLRMGLVLSCFIRVASHGPDVVSDFDPTPLVSKNRPGQGRRLPRGYQLTFRRHPRTRGRGHRHRRPDFRHRSRSLQPKARSPQSPVYPRQRLIHHRNEETAHFSLATGYKLGEGVDGRLSQSELCGDLLSGLPVRADSPGSWGSPELGLPGVGASRSQSPGDVRVRTGDTVYTA